VIASGATLNHRYTVREYIASGGMQDVYRAHDLLTDQEVALKTPQAGQGTRRFRQSAQLSSRVNHFNVAKTTDYFEEDGAQYLIEELVPGCTLEAATLDRLHCVDPHLGAHVFLRLAKGIASSHAAGVAHRDIKPGNILVSGGDAFTDIKITDFGIATLADHLFDEVVRNGGDLTRSTSGTIQGAFPYMAPEMMFRRPGDSVGLEADVWALGAVMFRLLTGEYPFGQAMMVPVNVNAGTRGSWPAFMTANAQYSALGSSLQAVVETCLVIPVDQRPTASALVTALEDLCFYFAPRQVGTVIDRTGNRCKLVRQGGGMVFFHMDSFYGPGAIAEGSRVCFASHPGSPYPRAHPVVLTRSLNQSPT
jgi:serine/threonine protein kinase, bacterial